MLAFTGALVQSYGMHFDGKLNGMFFEKGVNPFEATPSAFATNPMGMAQILLFIGLTEGYTFPEGAWCGAVWKSTGVSGASDNSSLSHFSAMTRPSWLGRAARNRHRHAIEQASRRWRGGRRDDSARTRRKI